MEPDTIKILAIAAGVTAAIIFAAGYMCRSAFRMSWWSTALALVVVIITLALVVVAAFFSLLGASGVGS